MILLHRVGITCVSASHQLRKPWITQGGSSCDSSTTRRDTGKVHIVVMVIVYLVLNGSNILVLTRKNTNRYPVLKSLLVLKFLVDTNLRVNMGQYHTTLIPEHFEPDPARWPSLHQARPRTSLDGRGQRSWSPRKFFWPEPGPKCCF
jgi:hypothetical protein